MLLSVVESNMPLSGIISQFGKPHALAPAFWDDSNKDFLEKFGKKSVAQGTIEYLVIISIVVVLALVVVGIVINQTDSVSNISASSGEISSKIGVGGISLGSSIAGVDGNGLLVIKNNTGENLVLDKIIIDGINHNFSEQLVSGDEKSFKLQDVAACEQGSKNKTYSVKVEYISSSGLTKTSDFQTLSLECTDVVTPASTAVEEKVTAVANIVPGISLGSPSDDYSVSSISSSVRVSFIYTPNDSDGTISSCSLNLTGIHDANSSSSISEGSENTLQYTLTPGTYDWNIACVDNNNDTNTSDSRSLTIASNLVAHYLMNDNTASTVILDNRGSYNGATALTNTSSLTTAGKINGALSFASGTRNYANLSSVKSIFSGTNDWTITLWEKTNNASYHLMVFSVTNNNLYSYHNKDNGYLSYGYPWSGINTSYSISSNTWYHFVFMRSSGTYSYYVNGTRLANTATNQTSIDVSSSIFSVGGASNAAQEPYYDYSTRIVDDVRVYNKALTQDEINAIYNSGNGTESE